ncbi:hypothetical protein BTVI_63193 [Pitangus sulphuratus]|nr:hypothetical protein BTVI_63193 [Pitangus sulphuratus]
MRLPELHWIIMGVDEDPVKRATGQIENVSFMKPLSFKLDLKDTFFCLPLDPKSQNLFTFGWENLDNGCRSQLTWTVLPQRFRNSPTIFGNQLAKYLEEWTALSDSRVLLQYVDDLLIANRTQDKYGEWTVSLLNFLGLKGYKVSKSKAQIVKKEVTYLGYEISGGQRRLGSERKEAICKIPLSQTPKELRTFLGMAGVGFGSTNMD